MNWWLVAHHLKHGMMTVRPAAAGTAMHGRAMGEMGSAAHGASAMAMRSSTTPRPSVPVMALLSFLALAAGVAITLLARAR
jgi:hypothetical protein